MRKNSSKAMKKAKSQMGSRQASRSNFVCAFCRETEGDHSRCMDFARLDGSPRNVNTWADKAHGWKQV